MDRHIKAMVDKRTRAHIKAVIQEMKRQTDGSGSPAQVFISGMLTGLTTAIRIMDGATAEDALETVVTQLTAPIGRAYLSGDLPDRPQGGGR